MVIVKKKKLSLYQQHLAQWKNCQLCPLHKNRQKVVLAKGKIPSKILFIGEAPGISEDTIGIPFVGPAGKLLDHIIERSLDGQYDYAMTNLVGCLPIIIGAKNEPSKKSISTCHTRLMDFIELCNPKLIITVGLLATKYTPIIDGISYVGITHPAAILRADISAQSLVIKRCIVTIEDAVEKHL